MKDTEGRTYALFADVKVGSKLDDEGGFKPHEDAPEVAAARSAVVEWEEPHT